jgi:hypothetical protein
VDPRTERMLADREEKAAATPPLLRGTVRAVGDLKFRAKGHGSAVKAGVAFVAVVMFAGYYLLIARPAAQFEASQLSAHEADRIRNDVAARPMAMEECLSKAAADAEARWKAACKARRERAGCALTARENQALRQKESEERNTCLLRFSVTAQ